MTPEYNALPEADLSRMFDQVSYLLVDFDGPLCRLFADGHAPDIAQKMLELAAEREESLAHAAQWKSTDPHWIVRGALSADLTGKLESLLTAEEEYAAATAEPTIGAEDFVRSAQARGWTLAITTNNAPQSVEKYLKIHRWDDIFGGRIFGRRPEDPSLMKPDPDCLRRAMFDLGAAPADCLMIGDSRADAEAAGKAMVPFVGFAANGDRAAQLRKAAPAAPVVVGMEPLIAAVRAARAKRPPKG